MPRRKKTDQSEAPALAFPPIPEDARIVDLIKSHNEFLAFVEDENARFAAFMKPYLVRIEDIKNLLLARSNAEGWQNQAFEGVGTAYRSTVTSQTIDPDSAPYIDPETGRESTGRDALIDYALANWEQGGNALLMVRPQAEAVRDYMQAHDGAPPPGVKVTSITRINIKRA